MSKASGAGNAIAKILTFLLAVLLMLGIAAVALFFVMRSQGMTYYVEYNGKQYLAGTDVGSLLLRVGETHTFAVKSLDDDEVDYSVKIVSNKANNLMFTIGDEFWYLWNDDEERDDYSEVFGLKKQADSFSLTIPEDFTVEKAIETKYGGNIELKDELQNDLCYFVITVTAETSSVNLNYLLYSSVTDIEIKPPQIII